MILKNIDVRLAISEAGIKYGDVARQMKVTPTWLLHLLRYDLSDKDKARILDAIKKVREDAIKKAPKNNEEIKRITGNKVNLCASCIHSFPACPAEAEDIIFGDGIGGDNICCCSKYHVTERVEK